MRIAYLNYLYGNDTAKHHVRQFAAAIRRLGHEIDVHAMNLAPAEETGEEAPSPVAAGGKKLRAWLKRRVGRFLHEPKEVLWNARYAPREVARLRAGPRPDVLLVRDHALTASAVPVAARLGLPLVLEVNAPARELGLYYDEYFHYPWVAEALEGWKLRRADAVIVVSAALQQYLVARHRLAPEKVAVVRNGADLAAFRPAAGSPPGPGPRSCDGAVVGFVGSFQKFHGAELLAEMALAVAAARPAVRFLFVGEGPEAAGVRLRTAPLGERVRFTGGVPHERVPELVASFDIGVLPDTSFYACPLKVIEWMAAGKAVVAPCCPPLRELVVDGVEGLLFAPRDPASLAAAVVELVDRPDLRAALGRAAAARAHRGMGWEHNAERVLAVCGAAMAKAPETPGAGAAKEARALTSGGMT